MIKHYLVLIFMMGFILGLGSMDFIDAEHKPGELKIHLTCFDMWDLERVKTSVNSDVLLCEQVMLLWDIRDKLIGDTIESDNLKVIFTSNTSTIVI